MIKMLEDVEYNWDIEYKDMEMQSLDKRWIKLVIVWDGYR
jgi:hypothetical protein